MLAFVGLGLYDERSITVEGRELVARADRVFAEFYTSRLAGATVEDIEAFHGVTVEVRDRAGIERDPEPVLAAAESGLAVLLVGGDPMVSTTHVDLRLRAHERGIDSRVVHGTSAATAAAGLAGLQNYRFGPATTLPFPDGHGAAGVPDSVRRTLRENRERDLHTLVYLDVDAAADRYMTADRAAELLLAARRADDPAHDDPLGGEPPGDGDAGSDDDHDHDHDEGEGGSESASGSESANGNGDGGPLAVAVARAGSPDPRVEADRLAGLAAGEFGAPPHLLVVPGELHHMERAALRAFADADV